MQHAIERYRIMLILSLLCPCEWVFFFCECKLIKFYAENDKIHTKNTQTPLQTNRPKPTLAICVSVKLLDSVFVVLLFWIFIFLKGGPWPFTLVWNFWWHFDNWKLMLQCEQNGHNQNVESKRIETTVRPI